MPPLTLHGDNTMSVVKLVCSCPAYNYTVSVWTPALPATTFQLAAVADDAYCFGRLASLCLHFYQVEKEQLLLSQSTVVAFAKAPIGIPYIVSTRTQALVSLPITCLFGMNFRAPLQSHSGSAFLGNGSSEP